MKKRQYLLTVRIPFGDIDDFGAREKAHERLKAIGISTDDQDKTIKLQCLDMGKEPRNVKL